VTNAEGSAPSRPQRGILDTSAVIALRDIADPASLPAEPLITTVTLAELSVGPLVARDDTVRAARQAQLQEAEADFDPLPFDRASARAFGQVAACLRGAGRKTSARAYDALIAAIAVSNDLPVYTCNADDFAGIGGLEVVDLSVSQQPRALPSPPSYRLRRLANAWPMVRCRRRPRGARR
jgi:tRNA(fMet)-specific endonuclease VapC